MLVFQSGIPSAVPSSQLLENSSVFSLGPGLGQFPYSRRS